MDVSPLWFFFHKGSIIVQAERSVVNDYARLKKIKVGDAQLSLSYFFDRLKSNFVRREVHGSLSRCVLVRDLSLLIDSNEKKRI